MADGDAEVVQQHKNDLPRAILNADGRLVFEQLCGQCEWVDRGIDQERGIRVSSGALRVEGVACPPCSIFRAAVRHYERHSERDYPVKELCGIIRIEANMLELWWDFGELSWVGNCCIFTPLVSTARTPISSPMQGSCHGNAAQRALDRFRIHDPHAGSDQSVQLLKEWLQDCSQFHQPACYQHETALPDRVLDVGTSALPTVRLRASRGIIGRYFALSHCWGSDELHRPMTTTRETLARREAGIDEEALPRTFRDAVTLTRSLGVRYLWIDSLCIIQDNHQDWHGQSAQMGTIFSNAFLVIAATRAAHSGEGFLLPRQLDNFAPFCCDIVSHVEPQHPSSDCPEKSGTIPLHIMPLPSHIPFLAPRRRRVYRYGRSVAENYPLLTRAWCLQERILATRIVHYENEEMVWECRTRGRCECTIVDQETLHAPAGYESGSLLPVRWAKVSPKSTLAYVSSVWQETFTAFSALDITFDSDRFAAISGLAKRLQTAYDLGRYMCGLWERTLFYDLAWAVRNGNIGLARRAAPWLAPTWSWACLSSGQMHNAVALSHYHNKIFQTRLLGANSRSTPSGQPFEARLIAFEQTLRGSDPTGPVLSASLTLSAPAVRRRIVPRPPVDLSDSEDSHSVRLDADWRLHPCDKHGTESPEELFYMYPDCPEEDFAFTLLPVDVLCVWICSSYPTRTLEDRLETDPTSSSSADHSSSLPFRAYLLVVREVRNTDESATEPNEKLYQRVGLAIVQDPGCRSAHKRGKLSRLYEQAEVMTLTLV